MSNLRENIVDVVSKMPMAVVVALFAVGIFLGDRVEVPLWLYGVALATTICGALLVKGVWRVVGVLFALLFLGATLHSMSFRGEVPYDKPLNMWLEVEQMTALRSGYTSTEARVIECEEASVEGRKVVIWGDSLLCLSANDRLGVCLPLRRFRAERDGYAKLMHNRRFVGSVSISSRTNYEYKPSERRSLHDIATERLKGFLSEGDARGVVLAMTVGERGEITAELRQAYAESGTSHLLAVSGLHVGIIFFIINLLLVPLAMLRYGNVVRSVAVVVLIWLYVVLCGMSPSAVRAAIMFSLLQLSITSLKSYNSINILATTAFVMLLLDTRLLFDISFELSFIAVAGILLWAVPFYGFVRTRFRIVNSLIAVMCVGVASTLVTLPLVASTFSVVSLVGVLINPVAILLAYGVVMFGMVSLLLPAAAPLALAFAEWQNRVVVWAAGLPYSHFDYNVSEGAMWSIYALFAVVSLIIFVIQRKKR